MLAEARGESNTPSPVKDDRGFEDRRITGAGQLYPELLSSLVAHIVHVTRHSPFADRMKESTLSVSRNHPLDPASEGRWLRQ